MAQAVALSKLGDPVAVDWALGHAAVNSRFAEADLASIITHHARSQGSGPRHQATESRSLTQGTGAWAALQRPGEHAQPETTGDQDRDRGENQTGRGDQAGDPVLGTEVAQ